MRVLNSYEKLQSNENRSMVDCENKMKNLQAGVMYARLHEWMASINWRFVII